MRRVVRLVRTGALVLALTALSVGRIAAATDDGADVPDASAAQLSREFTDPLTTLPQLSLQDIWGPANYGTDARTNRVILRAVVPRIPRFSLLPFVQLVRPTFNLVTVPTGRGRETRTAFGDIQLVDLAVMPWPGRETGLLMGLGPVFNFPTATDDLAGQGSWQMGPAFGAIYKGIPGVLLGCLIQNPVSFAYTNPDRRPVNTLLFQPLVLMHLGRGWYVKSADSTWTHGWRDGQASVIPLSLGLGYIFVRAGLPPLNAFVTGEWTVYRHDAPVASQTAVRFGLTAAFPFFRPWR